VTKFLLINRVLGFRYGQLVNYLLPGTSVLVLPTYGFTVFIENYQMKFYVIVIIIIIIIIIYVIVYVICRTKQNQSKYITYL
jgi:hypothetical protein